VKNGFTLFVIFYLFILDFAHALKNNDQYEVLDVGK